MTSVKEPPGGAIDDCGAVDASNGTDVCPGTHVERDFAGGEIPWQDATQMEPLAPSLAPGEILLFDYRLKHRGRANTTAAPRPLGYFVFSRPGLSDAVNFAHASLEADVAPHLLALTRAEAACAAGAQPSGSSHTPKLSIGRGAVQDPPL